MTDVTYEKVSLGEETFWYLDYSFLLGVVENKIAYEGWVNYVLDREREKDKKR